jgi:hypothetical protein
MDVYWPGDKLPTSSTTRLIWPGALGHKMLAVENALHPEYWTWDTTQSDEYAGWVTCLEAITRLKKVFNGEFRSAWVNERRSG